MRGLSYILYVLAVTWGTIGAMLGVASVVIGDDDNLEVAYKLLHFAAYVSLCSAISGFLSLNLGRRSRDR